jgi:uncharacterized protein (TIGR02145 family)
MTIWSGEINELDTLYQSFKGHLPDIVNELEQLIHTQDANVVMLYSRRCLEVIITDLCEVELKRPRKTEPLKGIIDKLNSEEKVPSHIITSMQSLNSMATYGTHPKDFDPEQVKPVLINLAIIIRWYLKYKDFQIISKTKPEEEMTFSKGQDDSEKITLKPKKRKILLYSGLMLGIVIIAFIVLNFIVSGIKNRAKNIYFINSGDNQIYKEIKIGDQVWMAENLRTTLFNDGTAIPLATENTVGNNLKTPAYCWYNNNAGKYEKSAYGALYNWYAVNTGKLCSTGWHVPTDAEWAILTDYLGGERVAGDKLKETGTTHWESPNFGATNETGFTALPGGSRDYNGSFGIGIDGSWWSSTEEYSFALFRSMNYSNSGVNRAHEKRDGFSSVRCVKNLTIDSSNYHIYKTVRIGNQVWMAENLKTTRYNDGTPIPLVTDDSLWKNSKTPAYCWYVPDEPADLRGYGVLYNWHTVNTGKLCPTGWHVPSNAEWEALTHYLGDSVSGDKLKETGTTHWTISYDKNINPTNESGFTALPGGYRDFKGAYTGCRHEGCWWSSTEYDEDDAWYQFIYLERSYVESIECRKFAGFSVRCVKDSL